MQIILADHNAQPLWALKAFLQEQPGFNLIGEAMDAQGLLTLAETQPADLILVDGELPGMRIEDLFTRLHALEPKPIVIAMSSDFASSRRLLIAGADAFSSKSAPSDWLLEVLLRFEPREIE